MKKKYLSPIVVVETFEATDIITESPSAYDGLGFIPGGWMDAWV